jgi:hypothetical protein
MATGQKRRPLPDLLLLLGEPRVAADLRVG